VSSELVKLPTSTAVERIYAASIEEAEGTGPGLAGLSAADQLINRQIESAYGMLLSYKSFDRCWPLLAKQFGISRATCYRRLADALNLMGDLTKVKKQAARAMLIHQAQQLKELCLEQRPPDIRGAAVYMKLEAVLRGLNKPDTGAEEGGAGAVSTSYVINVSYQGARGPKSQQIDITKLNDVSDADYELLQGAIAENVLGVEGMVKLLAETRGEEVAPDGDS
jgi:hypothetical protein